MKNRLPKQVVERWSKMKPDVLARIDKIKGPMVTAAQKTQLKAKAKALYDKFNKGLSAKLKTASTAKQDADAKAALKDVITITGGYKIKAQAAIATWGADDSLGKVFLSTLDKIKDACKRTLQAMNV